MQRRRRESLSHINFSLIARDEVEVRGLDRPTDRRMRSSAATKTVGYSIYMYCQKAHIDCARIRPDPICDKEAGLELEGSKMKNFLSWKISCSKRERKWLYSLRPSPKSRMRTFFLPRLRRWPLWGWQTIQPRRGARIFFSCRTKRKRLLKERKKFCVLSFGSWAASFILRMRIVLFIREKKAFSCIFKAWRRSWEFEERPPADVLCAIIVKRYHYGWLFPNRWLSRRSNEIIVVLIRFARINKCNFLRVQRNIIFSSHVVVVARRRFSHELFVM